MPKIIVLPHQSLCPEGDVIEAKKGDSVCNTLLENGIAIEHACDQVCACTTCHVIVREGFNSLNPSEENEDDMPDKAGGGTPQSRLSGKAIVQDQDLTIELPTYPILLAKEG